MTARLAIVGAPGAGKSSVAAELAHRWECPLRDTDADYGSPVSDAIIEDEAAFRQAEEALVLAALREPGAVVAVGSGAVTEPVLRALQDTSVVWLEVGLSEAARRTGLSGMRPRSIRRG